MSSIDQRELFEQYYQNKYDFNTASLSADEIAEIKQLAREKRVDYNLAPLGTGVFGRILQEGRDIRFEKVAFESEKIDGMLYIPTTGKERAYIILNSNKPLINQIFTAAHEYYHYIMDYQKFKEMPYICDFSLLKDVNEKKACRFAAELLLPEEALYREIQNYRRIYNKSKKEMTFEDYATLMIFLTVRYQMPLKAVIYRLYEEQYITDINRFIENYDFIKRILKEIKIFKKSVAVLYSTENDYVLPDSSIYQDMEKSFATGNASRENILEDAALLGLDMNVVEDFLDVDQEGEDEEDDEELFSIINEKRRWSSMITPLKKTALHKLLDKPVLFDANIFMVGISDRVSDKDYTFENMKKMYIEPLFESFTDIYIHEEVYKELDEKSKAFVDLYIGKNVTVVGEGDLYGRDPRYTTIFNHIAGHELVNYVRGRSKDRGEVYSLAYAAYHNMNYFCSKESIMQKGMITLIVKG